MKKKKYADNITQSRHFYALVCLMGLVVVSGILSRSFFTADNFITILRQASVLAIMSFGLTAVVLTGNIDLSVGSFAALCGCICAQMLVQGRSLVLAACSALLVGVLFGLTNGLLVGLLKLPSFVATYGMNMVAAGLATIVMNGGVIYALPRGFTRLGTGFLWKIPIPVLVAVAVGIIMYFLLQKTVFGRNVYLIGMNPQAARYSAVDTLGTLLWAYVICGISGALGGIIMTARLNAADAGMTEAYGIKIIAAVVVGGTSLSGGEGGIAGTVTGALILTVIVNIMNIMGVRSEWQNLVVGVMILLMAAPEFFLRKTCKYR